MKLNKSYLVLALIIVLCGSCNTDKETIEYSSFISGKVSFKNPVTNEQTTSDSIKTVLLKSTPNNQFYNSIDERKGPGFIFGPLDINTNDYKIEFSYKLDLSPDGTNFYAFYKDTSVNISAKEQVHDLGDVILNKLTSTHLSVNVRDDEGNPLPNINICLYRNPNLIDTLYNCNNAERSNITVQSGSTVLGPLENNTYYIKAWGCYGEFGYDNIFDEEYREGILIAKDTTVNIVLKKRPCEMEPTTTELEIKAIDENGYPLPSINICLFLNPDFVDTTYNCDNSEHALKTNEYGLVTFSELDTLEYYFKSWGDFDSYVYDNFYDGAIQSTGQNLQEGEKLSLEVILKKTEIIDTVSRIRN